MAKTVRVIPATINQATMTPINSLARRKVAGYARVSTDLDEQQSSYEAQVSYYTAYIKSRADWEFVEVYTDEGISATNTRHRDGFNRMIADALAGITVLSVTSVMVIPAFWACTPMLLWIEPIFLFTYGYNYYTPGELLKWGWIPSLIMCGILSFAPLYLKLFGL